MRRQGNSNLEQWVEQVGRFGGRIQPAIAQQLLQELRDSRLGGRVVVPTSSATPLDSLQPIEPLCEMRVSRPIATDVTISVEGQLPLYGSGIVLVTSRGVDLGESCVIVTWGSQDGVRHQAKVDIGKGWRFPFFASYLRVDYLPEDTDQTATYCSLNSIGAQTRDATVQASIEPASGAPVQPLTRTMFVTTVTGLGNEKCLIPQWAVAGLAVLSPSVANPIYSVEFLDRAQATNRSQVFGNNSANSYPSYAPQFLWQPVTPDSFFARISSLNAGTTLLTPKMMFRLGM